MRIWYKSRFLERCDLSSLISIFLGHKNQNLILTQRRLQKAPWFLYRAVLTPQLTQQFLPLIYDKNKRFNSVINSLWAFGGGITVYHPRPRPRLINWYPAPHLRLIKLFINQPKLNSQLKFIISYELGDKLYDLPLDILPSPMKISNFNIISCIWLVEMHI